MVLLDVGMALLKVIIIVMMVINLVPVLVWMERKGAAYIQDRRGPNRAEFLGIRLWGLLHTLADAVKLITKAEITGKEAARPLFFVAPMLGLFVAIVVLAVIPFAEPLRIGNFEFSLHIADLGAGLIYVLALSSLSVYAVLLGGWAGGGRYSMLGAMRGSSQMLSYELAMGLSVVAVFLVAGSFRLTDIVAQQDIWPWEWNIVRLPLTFLLFFTSVFAETNRLPFDLPEGESELAAGYHTEYSSMRFGIYFMAEYAHIIVGSLLVTMLFCGGWHIPFVTPETLRINAANLLGVLWVGAGGIACALSVYLLTRFVRYRGFWGDRRDFETLIFGVLCGGIGAFFLSSYFSQDDFVIAAWVAPVMVFLIQLGVVLAKTLFFISVFIWVRWTLPRFRYDQLMRFGWKLMIPLGIINLFVVGGMVLLWKI